MQNIHLDTIDKLTHHSKCQSVTLRGSFTLVGEVNVDPRPLHFRKIVNISEHIVLFRLNVVGGKLIIPFAKPNS